MDVPIWRGGRIQADVAQADAVLDQRRSEYEDTRGRVDFDVRSAFLALTAATEQVKVADSNRALAQRTLQQARDRFVAGVTDTIEVVQAQESVAAAEIHKGAPLAPDKEISVCFFFPRTETPDPGDPP